MTMLSRNTATLLLSASSVVVHIHAFVTTSATTIRPSSSLFYKDVNKDDEIYTFPNNLDLPEMSHNWKPEMPSYPQGISPFDVFEESLGQETNQADQPTMHGDISSSLPKPLFEGEQDGLDQHIKATSFPESAKKKAQSKTNMYKRGGSSFHLQKNKTTQLKTDKTSRHLSSNVSWLPATLATSNANSLMENVQTKPVSLASSPKISSNSSTYEAVQQSTMKRFSIKNISSISDSVKKLHEKVFKNVKESQKALAPKLDSVISQRKIALLQMASVLHETVRRWKRVATRELGQTTARIYALISNMDITSYRLPLINMSLFRKSTKKQANTSTAAAIPTASASSKYLSSLRVSIATSTIEKPSIATIRYLDVLPSQNDFDMVAF